MYEYCLCIFMYTMCVPGPEMATGVLDTLELEFQTFVIHCVGAGNQNQALCKTASLLTSEPSLQLLLLDSCQWYSGMWGFNEPGFSHTIYGQINDMHKERKSCRYL